MNLPALFEKALISLSCGEVGDKRYLLAVSGGVDSMSLADLFLQSRLKPVFSIAHVNFSLRGKESDRDESLVRQWGEQHDIDVFVKRFNTAAYSQEKGISIEMAARDLRYGWFEALIAEHSFDFLVTAHNLNDSAETLLLNLLRGTGINGITGIRKRNGNVIRPLLGFKRCDIVQYASSHYVTYRNDSTNFESSYSRNKIRNLVFPLLQTINPSFIDTFGENMEHFSQAAGILNETASQISAEITRKEGNTTIIDLNRLSAFSHNEFHLYGILNGYGFNSGQIKDIGEVASQSGKTFNSPTHTLLTGRNILKIFPKKAGAATEVVVAGAGTYRFGDVEFSLEISTPSADLNLHTDANILRIDAARLKFPLTCRSWREGDRFRPFGMKRGSKKLSDFYTDLKMDLREKDLQPVLCDSSGQIICLPGLRIDDRFRITLDTPLIATISKKNGL